MTKELARRFGASIRLRIDDLDAERERPEFVEDIFQSLAWLGISWSDGPRDTHEQERVHSQRFRIPRYLERLDLLKEQGDLYACSCSRGDIRRAHCSCRQRGLSFHAANVCWRLHIPEDAFVRMRGVAGADQLIRPAQLMSDPVLRQRQDLGGRPAYQIASVVDDVEHGISFIVRGEDLLPSTACQLYIAERSGLDGFLGIRFLHHPLLTDERGEKLSKSDGALALRTLREQGAGPGLLKEQSAAMLRALTGTHSSP